MLFNAFTIILLHLFCPSFFRQHKARYEIQSPLRAMACSINYFLGLICAVASIQWYSVIVYIFVNISTKKWGNIRMWVFMTIEVWEILSHTYSTWNLYYGNSPACIYPKFNLKLLISMQFKELYWQWSFKNSVAHVFVCLRINEGFIFKEGWRVQ